MKRESKTKRAPISAILTVSLIVLLAPAISAMADTVTLFPNAAGDLTQLTPEPPGSVNWENMTTDDGDGSFVEMAATGDWRTDLYNFEDPAVSGTINWVRVYVKARSGRAVEAEQAGLMTAIGTGDLTHQTGQKLSGAYSEYYTEHSQNPDTSTNWTWEEIDALQAGVSLRRSFTSPGIKWSRATEVWVVVDYTPVINFYFAGWRPPVQLPPPAVGPVGWKSGSTMPVKFLVVDGDGNPVTEGVVATVKIGDSGGVLAMLDDAEIGQWKAEVRLVGSGLQAVTITGNVTGVTPLSIDVKP